MMMTKKALSDLAFFGGFPAFAHPLCVGKPELGDRARFLSRVGEILDSGWLTNGGPYVRRLEAAVAERTGTAHCVVFSSATVALELLIEALGLRGEVIVPSFTFAATAHALARNGVRPVFCDVDPRTFCIDPAQVETLITPRTSAILGVHCWGQPCDVDALASIASKHHVELIFDAAHAFASSYRGRPVGGFGSAEVFSFHATKFVHTFEGGAITTNNGKLATKLRLLRNFGFDGDDSVVPGTNGKLSEVSAAMGLTTLESLPEILASNAANHRSYTAAMSRMRGISVVQWSQPDGHNYQYVVVLVDPAQARLNRDVLRRILDAENVQTKRYFYPGCHQLEVYRVGDPLAATRLPHTERLLREVLVVPSGTGVRKDDIERIADIFRCVLENVEGITEAISDLENSRRRISCSAPPLNAIEAESAGNAHDVRRQKSVSSVFRPYSG
jgi:dTDP-4-amino-4,6-dideoxygalactose transaminase